jgi:predicted phage terminase large subunit-like protein
MQRLHEEDLSGWLLAGGNGEHWDHVCIPAMDEAGNSFWPRQFSPEMLRRIEATQPYVFAGQYMQRPAPIGGGIFKDEWWVVQDAPPPLTHRQIFADTAQKAKQSADYSVFQCWGYTSDGRAVLLDMIRGKWEAPDLLTRARAFWAKHKADTSPGMGALRALNVEDKVSGTGLIQTLRREGIPVVGIPRSVDKVTRAYDAAPKIQSQHVILLSDVPHLSDMLSEASTFPNAAHDDTIDPMMDAVAAIDGPARRTPGMLVKRAIR